MKHLSPRHRKPTKITAARLVARARKEIAAGMPLIPKEVADRIAGGENALRVLREWRCKTQLYIAHKTNIGQGYISDLEKGEATPWRDGTRLSEAQRGSL
jgi:hypothetical protein